MDFILMLVDQIALSFISLDFILDAPNNRIVVGNREGLFSRGIIATDFISNVPEKNRELLRAKAKIRLNHQESNTTIEAIGKDIKKIIFDEPQLSITPGQSVVLYEDDIVLGGGIIKETFAGSEPDKFPFIHPAWR